MPVSSVKKTPAKSSPAKSSPAKSEKSSPAKSAKPTKTTKPKLGPNEARCMKCKKAVTVAKPKLLKPTKGPFRLTGECPICGTKVTAFKSRQ